MWSNMTDVRYKKKPYRYPKSTLPTKLVLRRLPPKFTESIILKTIGNLPAYNYKRFESGRKYSRFYISFVNNSDLIAFKEQFDNYKFYDNKGKEYCAIVEFAPCQGFPMFPSFRRDPLCGTIEKDDVFQSFVKALSIKEETKRADFDFQLNDNISNNPTTPLLKFISERKSYRYKNEREKDTIKAYKKKSRDSGLVFVNSNVKNRFYPKFGRKKQVSATA